MQLAMIGLGRMGGNVVRRLMRGGHECVVHDVDATAIEQLTAEGAIGATSQIGRASCRERVYSSV